MTGSETVVDVAGEHADEKVVELIDVAKSFDSGGWSWRRAPIWAVRGVSLHVAPGETLGLVGESGSGKSTLGRLMLRLVKPTAGVVRVAGEDVTDLPERRIRAARRWMQLVAQSPYDSFDRRATLGSSLEEPLLAHEDLDREERRSRIAELFEMVHLSPALATRYPSELSGGQLQRLAIARAVSVRPRLIVLDEPVSALDVSIRAGVLHVLAELQRELGLSYVFIAHDLPVVAQLSDRIAVMHAGLVVEEGPADVVVGRPNDPYTKRLLDAIPNPDPKARRHPPRPPSRLV